MMRLGKKIAVSVSCLTFMGMAGCGRVGHLDERERNNRIVAKAYEMANQGDYDSAIALFTKALETYPRLSRPHLDLALLLHDRQHDYVRAIYHYKRYLELRPGTEKASMIRDRIRQAERAFGALYTVDGAAPGNLVEALETENSDLKQRNVALEERLATLEQELGAVREEERQRYKAAVVGGDAAVSPPPPVVPKPEIAAPVVAPTPTVAVTAPLKPKAAPQETPAVPATVSPARTPSPPVAEPRATAVVPKRRTPAPAEKPVVRTYTVRRGDSLSKIAYKVYGDATLWRKIQDANAESLGDSVNVKVGQVLVVP
jgi:LysM repeat protein